MIPSPIAEQDEFNVGDLIVERVKLFSTYQEIIFSSISYITALPNYAGDERLKQVSYTMLEGFSAVLLAAYSGDVSAASPGEYTEELEDFENILGEDGVSLQIPTIEELDTDFRKDLAVFEAEGADVEELLDEEDAENGD